MPLNRSFRVPARSGFGPAFAGRAPADLVALLAVVFATYAMQFFATTAAVPESLRLDPLAWRGWQLWRIATYPLAGYGPASIWILLELLVLYWFARDLRSGLGARLFWSLLAAAGIGAGVVATAVDAGATLAFGPVTLEPFALMQGQRTLIAIAIAAFASRNAQAVIYLFFVLPVRAGAFVWISVLIAFVGFLATKDLGGLAGLWTATAIAYWRARPGGGRPSLRRLRLRWNEAVMRWRLDRLRRRSGLRVVDGDRKNGPTIN